MRNQESPEDRKKRFKSMSSSERRILIRKKMKTQGLEEGSGVSGKGLSSYASDEIWDLIQVTRYFPELHTKRSVVQPKLANKCKSLILLILFAMGFVGGMILYYEQYPSTEIRREISVKGIFMD